MTPIRDELRDLEPYAEQDRDVPVCLDRNEGRADIYEPSLACPGISLNLYPDSDAQALLEAVSSRLGIDTGTIMAGNGSSELIDLLIRTYGGPGRMVMAFEPTFAMYRIHAMTQGTRYTGYPVETDRPYDKDVLMDGIRTNKPDIVFLCSPNNPTGQTLDPDDVLGIASATDALVVLDEAYVEFSDLESLSARAVETDNLVVLRTFSKAYGLAAARIGYMTGPKGVISNVRKVAAPFRINALSQALALEAYKRSDEVESRVKVTVSERGRVYEKLLDMGYDVSPSQGNFLFVRAPGSDLGTRLLALGVLIRTLQPKEGLYRITIGREDENDALLGAIKEINDDKNR
jgi:histidinol-phosphate aminotransferase